MINKDNFDQYPLVECNTYISKCGNWMLEVDKWDIYRLIPNSSKATQVFFNFHSEVKGLFDYVNKIKTELDVYIL